MTAKLITSAMVRSICGNVSDMTLWRWRNDSAMNFPRPIYIARRRYWREADILTWIEERAKQAA
ncbi:AlpA family transcriptional regulator [Rhodobacter sp. CZR27]|uniref:helix-turn-helix transcriptional regulator n=1 Tax=Rhodobacter sp. CZR27 TaxID=2033869 RepID=UPI000BBE4E18|nr:transcriptional regulator [Rhodobacter sp. CZR27]